MTQQERRIFLIKELLSEQPRYSAMEIPKSEREQTVLLRSLLNLRMPKPVSHAFLNVQDAYLQEAIKQKGITRLTDLQPVQPDLYLWQGDITTLCCDAIVNAANSGMLGCFCPNHGCIDNAIHTFAGVQLRLACADLMNKQGHAEETGKAKITPAFNLPCKYILHTVGPIVKGRLTKKRAGSVGFLLPFLLGTGGEKWCKKYCALLYFYGRISLSPGTGGQNRRADRDRIQKAGAE